MLSIRIPMGEEEAELLQKLNGDELYYCQNGMR